MFEYKRRNQYCIYDLTCHATFVKRDVIFDKGLIGPQSDNSSTNPSITQENKVIFGFLSFYFPYILEINNIDSLVLADILAAIECDNFITPFELILSLPDTRNGNILSNILNTSKKSDDNISIAKTHSIIMKMAMPL